MKYRVELIEGTAEDMRSSLEAALNGYAPKREPVEYIPTSWGGVLVVFAEKGDN